MTNSAGEMTAVERAKELLSRLRYVSLPDQGGKTGHFAQLATDAADFIEGAVSPPEAAGARRETWEQEQSRIHSIAFDAVAEVLDLHAPELDDKARILIMTSAACRMVLRLATKHPPAPSALPPHSQASEVEQVADAIDAARYAHPEYPRERERPFAEADRSDREYATRLARAALAALSQAPQPAAAMPSGEWQTIESAPKDGARILGSDGKRQLVIFWHGMGSFSTGGWRIEAALQHFYPTHWQPLPAAPTAQGKA